MINVPGLKMVALIFAAVFFVSHPVAAKEVSVLNGVSSSLTIYSYPPREPLNWSSPRSVLLSFAGIEIQRQLTMNEYVKFESEFNESGAISSNYKSTMGHALVHVRCELPDGRTYDRWSSFSGQNFAEVDKKNLLKDKLGLGILFYNYIDGHIIAGEENVKRIVFYKGRMTLDEKGRWSRVRPRYMQFEISPEQCQRAKDMTTFFERFHYPQTSTLVDLERRDPRDVLYFTSQMDPYDSYVERIRSKSSLVGGGCAPYAASLLKVTGRYDASFDSFWRLPIQVSEKLIGGTRDPRTGTFSEVSLQDLLVTDLGSYWDHDGFANRSLVMYDPQKMWDFIGQALVCEKEQESELCPAAVLSWIQSKKYLATGQTQVFEDQYEEPIPHIAEAYSGSNNTATVRVRQPVQGLVWRLSRKN